MEENKCFKCGDTEGLILHHLSYNPEVVVSCCHSCHKSIHIKIRTNGLCPLSVSDVHLVSTRLSNKRIQQKMTFYDKIETGYYIQDQLVYNTRNGNVYYNSCFRLSRGRIPKTIEEHNVSFETEVIQ